MIRVYHRLLNLRNRLFDITRQPLIFEKFKKGKYLFLPILLLELQSPVENVDVKN